MLIHILGLVKCGECGAGITAEIHTKHYNRTNRTVTYVYYRCSKKKGHCSQKYIPREEIERQLRDILWKASLSSFATKKFLEWSEKDAQREQEKVATTIRSLTQQLKETEEKLDRLLEGYLDQVINSREYKKKKNDLVQTKVCLKQKIKEISKRGNEWLEPFQEFTKSALRAQKIARAKNNCHDLKIMAKTVGSNFFLKDRRLSAEYKNPGWNVLAARPIAANFSKFSSPISNLLASIDTIRTCFILNESEKRTRLSQQRNLFSFPILLNAFF